MTENRTDALARLDVFVGEWVIEARFPGDQPAPSNATGEGPRARSRFEWEKRLNGDWEHDFALTYRRVG